MNKKIIYIGLGLLVVGGAAYYFMSSKSKSSSGGESTGGEKSADSSSTDEGAGSDLGDVGLSKIGGGSKKQVRKDCRKAAKEKCGTGLGKGKVRCRKDYRRDCKAQGGFDDGGADFAFNGIGWDIDNVGF